jgi:hypothetical protein
MKKIPPAGKDYLNEIASGFDFKFVMGDKLIDFVKEM